MTTATKTKSTALTANARTTSGKGSARQMRREGQVPAIIYGKNQAPLSIALSENQVTQEYSRGRFRSRLVELDLDGKTVKALPKDVQFHPVSDRIEHVDFIKVEPGVKLHVEIPVKFTGTDKSPGIKRGGVLNVVRHEIEFICAPEAIPAFIEVSLSGLDIGSSVHINDIQLPKDVVPAIKRNFTVATVAGRSASMEEEVTPVAAAATAEGAVPAEGAAAAPGAVPAAGAAAPAAGAAAPAAAGGKNDEAKKPEGKK
jgi:large subunit ribosomal protein L25